MNNAISQINVPDLTPNSSRGKLQRSKMLKNNFYTYKLIGRTYKQAFNTWNVVHSYQINMVHLTMRHHRDLTSTKASTEWKGINQIFTERDHRTYLCNDYCVMCIGDSVSGWCSLAWRRSPFTGNYLTKCVIYRSMGRIKVLCLIYWTSHDVQQLRDLLDKPDRLTLVLEHKEQNAHCNF